MFVFNLFNAEKYCSEMTLMTNLNCNKNIYFRITSMEEIRVNKGLFYDLFMIINDIKSTV